jgi:hypothetical protein
MRSDETWLFVEECGGDLTPGPQFFRGTRHVQPG